MDGEIIGTGIQLRVNGRSGFALDSSQNIDPRLRFAELKGVDCCPALRRVTCRPRKAMFADSSTAVIAQVQSTIKPTGII